MKFSRSSLILFVLVGIILNLLICSNLCYAIADINDIPRYISSLCELQSKRVKLCDDNDPEAQLELAELFMNKDVREYLTAGNYNFSSVKDALTCQGLNEKGEKLFIDLEPGYKMFIVKILTGQPIGKCWVEFEKTGKINIGCWFGKLYWGNGYALDAIKTMLTKLYEDKIACPIIISTKLENINSLSAVEKGIEKFKVDDLLIEDKIKYSLEQKIVSYVYEFKIDERDPDFVIICVYVSDNNIYGDLKRPKALIRPELIEKGRRELKSLQLELIPIY